MTTFTILVYESNGPTKGHVKVDVNDETVIARLREQLSEAGVRRWLEQSGVQLRAIEEGGNEVPEQRADGVFAVRAAEGAPAGGSTRRSRAGDSAVRPVPQRTAQQAADPVLVHD